MDLRGRTTVKLLTLWLKQNPHGLEEARKFHLHFSNALPLFYNVDSSTICVGEAFAGLEIKVLIFLGLNSIVNFLQTNLFPLFLDRISKTWISTIVNYS
jgi:hypothetical protein